MFQGVDGHILKISEAMELLPEECQIYQNVDMLSEVHKIPTEYRKYVRNAPKLQEEFRRLENQFTNVRFDVGGFLLSFDFATRKTSLYVNWDPEHKRWNDDVTIPLQNN